MIHKFLKMGGFSSAEDLYTKYPNEEDFFNDYPEARQMAKGGAVVSEDWKTITGTDWSTAKKLGLTDGSYDANVALHKKLLNGEINLNSNSKPNTPVVTKQKIAVGYKKDYKSPETNDVEPDVVVRPSSVSSQKEKIKSKAAAKPNIPLKVYSDPSVAAFQGPTFGASPAYMPLGMGKQPAKPFNFEEYAAAHMPDTGIIVDKRTGMAYWNNDQGQTGSAPVMTGKNVNLNSNPYSLEFLEKHPKLRNTPVGNYLLQTPDIDKPYIKELSLDGAGPGSYYNYLMKDYKGKIRNITPIPGYGFPAPTAESLALHRAYSDNTNNPNDPEYLRRVRKLKSGDPLQKCGSFGCPNVLDEDYDEINAAFPTGDTLQVIDSRNAIDLAKLELMKKRTGQKRDGGQTDDYGIPTEEADRLRATSQINFTQPAYFQTGGPLSDNRYMYNQGGINEYNWGGSSNGPLGYFQEGGEEQEQETTDDTIDNDLIYQQYMNALQNNNELYDSFNSALLNEGQEQPEETAEDDLELRYGGIDNSNMKPQFATGGITNYGAFSPVMEHGGLKPNKGLIHKMAKAQFGLNTQAQSTVPTITSVTEGKKDFITKYLSGNVAKVMANNLYKEHQDMMSQGMNPNMDPNMGQNMDQGMEQMPQDMQQAYAEFGGSMYENLGQNQYAYGGGLHRFLPRHQYGTANTGQYEDEGSPENEAFWNTQVGNFTYPQVNPSYSVNPNSIGQQPLNNALETPPYENKPNQMIQNPFGDPNERSFSAPSTGYIQPTPNFVNQPQGAGQRGANLLQPNMETLPMITNQDLETKNKEMNIKTQEDAMMDKFKSNTAPKQPKQDNWFKSNSGNLGRGIIATMNKINAQLENREARKSEKEAISRGKYSGDRNFIEVPETSSSSGNWALNGQAEGMLRPNKYVPVEYLGYDAGNITNISKYGGTNHKKNTELYMTEDELEKFLKAGGQVEYLD